MESKQQEYNSSFSVSMPQIDQTSPRTQHRRSDSDDANKEVSTKKEKKKFSLFSSKDKKERKKKEKEERERNKKEKEESKMSKTKSGKTRTQFQSSSMEYEPVKHDLSSPSSSGDSASKTNSLNSSNSLYGKRSISHQSVPEAHLALTSSSDSLDHSPSSSRDVFTPISPNSSTSRPPLHYNPSLFEIKKRRSTSTSNLGMRHSIGSFYLVRSEPNSPELSSANSIRPSTSSPATDAEGAKHNDRPTSKSDPRNRNFNSLPLRRMTVPITLDSEQKMDQSAYLSTMKKSKRANKPALKDVFTEPSEPVEPKKIPTPVSSPTALSAGQSFFAASAAASASLLSQNISVFGTIKRGANKTFRQIEDEHWRFAQEIAITGVNLVLFKVFSLLRVEDLLSASLVHTTWYPVFKNQRFWMLMLNIYSKRLRANENDINIWQDPTSDLGVNPELDQPQTSTKFTLNQLVVRLTSNAGLVDQVDLKAFLMTYKTFTTTKNLVRKLIERYHVQRPGPSINSLSDTILSSPEDDENFNRKTVKPIQLRVCNVLKNLIENYYDDLEHDVLNLLRIFIMNLSPTDSLCVTLKKSLLERKGTGTSVKTPDFRDRVHKRKTGTISPNQDVMECSPEIIAEQLTIIEFEYFSAIKTEEFMTGDKKSDASAQVSSMEKMIHHFNKICRWVQEIILREEKVKPRAKKMETFIQIAQCLKELNNYETMMAIISGINDVAIHRLSWTRAEVRPKYMKMMDEMRTMMSSDNSYAAYRKQIQLQHRTACIPYIGIYRRDLIYFDVTGKGEKGVINFRVKKAMFSILLEIQGFQRFPYQLKEDLVVSAKLRTLPDLPTGVTHDDYVSHFIFNMSTHREPRNAVKADIQ